MLQLPQGHQHEHHHGLHHVLSCSQPVWWCPLLIKEDRSAVGHAQCVATFGIIYFYFFMADLLYLQVELTTTALENTQTAAGRSLAREVAGKYLRNVAKSFANTGAIFEKYNCEEEGKPGSGGEYDVQVGVLFSETI